LVIDPFNNQGLDHRLVEQAMTPEQALIQAVNRMGSQGAMARLCDVSQTAVWKWLNESKQLPAEHVLKVEAATNVARHDLRPDIYPRGLQDDVPFNPDPLEPPLVASGDEGSGNSATKTQTAVMEEHAVGASVDEADDGRPADALHSAGAR
jgi:DNA-binding transcriptional regulator YdaS (Cro superfamily)